MMSTKTPLPPALTFDAQPYEFSFPPKQTALLVIDMQRDFLLPSGFGDIQGGDLKAVDASIKPTKQLLDAFRRAGIAVFHTREGHLPDLSDCPSSKLVRQAAAPGNSQHMKIIGDKGAMGRLLVRGEYGHDLVDELQPLPNEVVIDKPGKGAFWNTTLMRRLKVNSITHLVVCGVTTECCFATTIREANDRGFECCGITEATAGYNASFKNPTLDMIHWSQGLFGFIGSLQSVVDCLAPYMTPPASVGTSTPPQTPPAWNESLDIRDLQIAYRGGLSPVTVIDALYDRIERYQKHDPAVWIHLESKDKAMEAAKELSTTYADRTQLPPLFGVPFSVKDSIDIAGLPTTTACPPLAHVPSRSARAYELIMSQGAIFIGKTNLDQLATGLTGCRSPYGIPKSVFNEKYISGGSSSGNAVSVGAELVSFSLATDTAGSGRVPAGFNGCVGYKPSRGLISFRGVTPACLSLDCISLTARTVEEASLVFQLCEGYDEEDPYARTALPMERHVNSIGKLSKTFNFGIPPPEALEVCSPVYRKLFHDAVQHLQSIGGTLVPIDWAPFEGGANLLYEGTFVSERMASLPDFWLESNRQHLHPVILELFEKVQARQSTAVQAYRDIQAKQLYTRQATSQFASATSPGMIALVVPTAPTHPLISAVLADPIALNSLVGSFTHFGNVLDLCGIAVPAGTYDVSEIRGEGNGKLPFSVTFLGPGGTDAEVLGLASRFQAEIARLRSLS